jgi:hypothetical protein
MGWYCKNGPNKGNFHCTCNMRRGGYCCFCPEKVTAKYKAELDQTLAWADEPDFSWDVETTSNPNIDSIPASTDMYWFKAAAATWSGPSNLKVEVECEDDGSEENIE